MRLYPILDLVRGERVDISFIERILSVLGPAFIQIRQKEGSDEDIIANTLAVLAAVERRSAGTRVVVNDRPDIAARCGAPVVHVGDTDMHPLAVRRRYPDLLVGYSTHSLADIEEANTWDLAYIGFGPVFPSHTKQTKRPTVLAQCAEAVRLSRHPIVFIGGITPENIGLLPDSERTQAAVISALGEFLNLKRA